MSKIQILKGIGSLLVPKVREVSRPYMKKEGQMVMNSPDAIKKYEDARGETNFDARNDLQQNLARIDHDIWTFNPYESKKHHYGMLMGGDRGAKNPVLSTKSVDEGGSFDAQTPTGSMHFSMKKKDGKGYANPADLDEAFVLEGIPNPAQLDNYTDVMEDIKYIVNISKDNQGGAPVPKSLHYATDPKTKEDLAARLRESEGGVVNGYSRYLSAKSMEGKRYGLMAQYQNNYMNDMARGKLDVPKILKGMEPREKALAEVLELPESEIQKYTRMSDRDLIELEDIYHQLDKPKLLQDRLLLKNMINQLTNARVDLKKAQSQQKVDVGVQDRALRQTLRKNVEQSLIEGQDEFRWPASDSVRFVAEMNYPIAKATQLYDKDILNEMYTLLQDAGVMTKKQVGQSKQYVRDRLKGLPNKPEVVRIDPPTEGVTQEQYSRRAQELRDQEIKDNLTYNRDRRKFIEDLVDGNAVQYSKPDKQLKGERKANVKRMSERQVNDKEQRPDEIVDFIYDTDSDAFHFRVNLDPLRDKAHTTGVPLYGAAPVGVVGVDQMQDAEGFADGGLVRRGNRGRVNYADGGEVSDERDFEEEIRAFKEKKAKERDTLSKKIKAQSTPLPDHEWGHGQDYHPDDIYKGGLEQLERGARQVPGAYASMLPYIHPGNWGLLPDMGGAQSPRMSNQQILDDATGAAALPKPETPFQHLMNFTGEVGTDIGGWMAAAKALKAGKKGVDATKRGIEDLNEFAAFNREYRKGLKKERDLENAEPLTDMEKALPMTRREFNKGVAAAGGIAALPILGKGIVDDVARKFGDDAIHMTPSYSIGEKKVMSRPEWEAAGAPKGEVPPEARGLNWNGTTPYLANPPPRRLNEPNTSIQALDNYFRSQHKMAKQGMPAKEMKKVDDIVNSKDSWNFDFDMHWAIRESERTGDKTPLKEIYTKYKLDPNIPANKYLDLSVTLGTRKHYKRELDHTEKILGQRAPKLLDRKHMDPRAKQEGRMFKEGTSNQQIIDDNWSRDIPIDQTYQEMVLQGNKGEIPRLKDIRKEYEKWDKRMEDEFENAADGAYDEAVFSEGTTSPSEELVEQITSDNARQAMNDKYKTAFDY